MTCALTGPLQIQDMKAIAGPEGHEVFSERKGLSLFQNKVPNASLAMVSAPQTAFNFLTAGLSQFLCLASLNQSRCLWKLALFSQCNLHLSLGCIADAPSETTL